MATARLALFRDNIDRAIVPNFTTGLFGHNNRALVLVAKSMRSIQINRTRRKEAIRPGRGQQRIDTGVVGIVAGMQLDRIWVLRQPA